MNNILAADVLIMHLPEISDAAYKTATEIAIETLLLEATEDWRNMDTKLSLREYLGFTESEYNRWILGRKET